MLEASVVTDRNYQERAVGQIAEIPVLVVPGLQEEVEEQTPRETCTSAAVAGPFDDLS